MSTTLTEAPVSFSLVSEIAPSGEPYTHVILHTADGTREILEVHPEEIKLAERELYNAIIEKRASYVVIHPYGRDGAEHHYPGTIAGLVKVTAAHAALISEGAKEAAEREEARRNLALGGGPVGRARR
jgi:hypothetical protein